MFKQQRKPAGYLTRRQLGLFKLKAREAGYELHDGARVERDGELFALRSSFEGRDGLRQNHVQVEARSGDVLAVYAHTEPHTRRILGHLISAVSGTASFSGGSKMLRNDLRAAGFKLQTYSQARAATKPQR